MAAERTLKAGWLAILLALALTGCAAAPRDENRKLALLAPFEGEYRAVGYNALYAVRMAIGDSEREGWQLLALDDGGSPESARDRVRALNFDPAVKAIVALGSGAQHPTAQQANDKPMVFVGGWGHAMSDGDSFCACDRALAEAGGDDDRSMAQVMAGGATAFDSVLRSSGALPQLDFAERYARSDMHAPKANWLASLTYDVARFVLHAFDQGAGFGDAAYDGMNGRIAFSDGYWIDAPIHHYHFRGGELIQQLD